MSVNQGYALINDIPASDPINPAPSVPKSEELVDKVQYGRGERSGHTNRWGSWIDGTDGIGRTTIYDRDAANNLTRLTYPDGACITYTYNQYGSRLSETHMTSEDCAGGEVGERKVLTYSYEPRFSKIKTETDALGNTTTYFYDYEENKGETGNLIRIEYPQVEDENGELVTPIRSNLYNELGLLDSEIDLRGTVTKYFYTSGSPEESSDGATPLFAANVTPVPGLLTKVVRDFGDDASNLNLTTIYQDFDAAGNAQTLVDEEGIITRSTFDVQGWPLTETDDQGNTTQHEYDNSGNIIRIAQTTVSDSGESSESITEYAYDAGNNLIAQSHTANGETQQTAYINDINAKLAQVIDSSGASTIFNYDNADQLITESGVSTNDAGFTYTLRGQLKSVVYADGSEAHYEYDDFGRRVRINIVDSDGSSTETIYAYDLNGNLIREETVGGEVTCNAYDRMNQLVSITEDCESADRVTHRIYNPAGDLLSVQRWDGSAVINTYDNLGFPISSNHNRESQLSFNMPITLASVSSNSRFPFSDFKLPELNLSIDISSSSDQLCGRVRSLIYEYDSEIRDIVKEFSQHPDHIERNYSNKCPKIEPSNCLFNTCYDCYGNVWNKEAFDTGFHGGLDSYRGTDWYTGSQCVYDNNNGLLDDDYRMGTYDFFSPKDNQSAHYIFDVLPHCENSVYKPNLTYQY